MIIHPKRLVKLKIFHGTTEIAGQMGIMSSALQQKGHIAVGYNTFHSYLGYENYIINTNRREVRNMSQHLIDFFDIFHFHYGRTIMKNNADLELIRARGKKMVMHHWGNDVRFHDQARISNPYVYTGDSPTNEVIIQKLSRISRSIREAIVQDHEVLPYVAPYYDKVHVVPIAIDLELFQPHYPPVNKRRPLIVHAPTNPAFKGTEPIERSIRRLQSHFDFDYVRVEKMNHLEAVKQYEAADIIVDQVYCGSYGLLSTEAMALGKPVIAFIREDLRKTFPRELPIVNTNPDHLDEHISRLLSDPLLRYELGIKGRRYVEVYHAKQVVVEKLLTIYEQLQPS